MRRFVSTLGLLTLVILAAAPARADDIAECQSRQAELAAKAKGFKGSTVTRRLIEADLKRALQEALEGEADECKEALDHAAKLLAGGA